MRRPKKFLHFIKAVGARLSNSQLLLASSSSLLNDGAMSRSAKARWKRLRVRLIYTINQTTRSSNICHHRWLHRTQRLHQRRGSRADKPKLVAVVPVSPGAALHLDAVVSSLMYSLRRICTARVADSANHLAEVGSAAVGALAQEATAFWLHQLEENSRRGLTQG